MARVLMVIPPERFRDEELFETREVLENEGHYVLVASTKVGKCLGSRGGSATAEITLQDVNTGELDAVVFVGGTGSQLLFHHERALQIAQEMHYEGKVVGAICLAPVILANAGVLLGRKATVAGSELETLTDAGATYMGPGVYVHGNVVTANAPKMSKVFGERLCELLDDTVGAGHCPSPPTSAKSF